MSWVWAALLVLFVFMLMQNKEDKPTGSSFSHKPFKEFYEVSPELAAPVPVNPSDHGWNDVIQNIALDPQVKKSHTAFVNAQDIVPRASANSIKELDTYPVPFVGLRRPNLNVPMSEFARVIPSEDVSQLPTSRPFII